MPFHLPAYRSCKRTPRCRCCGELVALGFGSNIVQVDPSLRFNFNIRDFCVNLSRVLKTTIFEKIGIIRK